MKKALLILVGAVLLVGCSTEGGKEGEAAAPADSPPTAGTTEATEATRAVEAEQAAYYAAWERSPHADTYAEEKGPNTYCARCHSPANWDPEATIDRPPNCVSCKFPSDEEMRVAKGNPPVPEEEWVSIGCPVCHRVTEEGVVQPEIAWRSRTSGYYESVPNSTALCEKCHLDNETLAHHRELGEAHAGFTCTECHDPHDASASCAACHTVNRERPPRLVPEHADVDGSDVNGNEDCAECHRGAWDSHPMHVTQSGNDNCMGCHAELMGQETLTRKQVGHSAYHADVHCVACHDATSLQIRQLQDEEAWTTFRTRELLGRALEEPYQSHTLQREVDCRRCHYPHNPWQLPEDVLHQISPEAAQEGSGDDG